MEALDPDALGDSGQIVSTVPDAGPLIQLEGDTEGLLNRVRNDAESSIRANLNDLTNSNHGIAVAGSAGVDEIINAGEIQGRIELGGGDDEFTAIAGSTLVDLREFAGGGPTVDGGDGADSIRLSGETAELGSFDPTLTTNFESLIVEGSWRLTGTTDAGLAVQIDPGGRLDVETETTIDSELSFGLTTGGQTPGRLGVTVSSESVSREQQLLVDGPVNLTEGALDISVDNQFSGTGEVTVVRATGGLTGEFENIEAPESGQRACCRTNLLRLQRRHGALQHYGSALDRKPTVHCRLSWGRRSQSAVPQRIANNRYRHRYAGILGVPRRPRANQPRGL